MSLRGEKYISVSVWCISLHGTVMWTDTLAYECWHEPSSNISANFIIHPHKITARNLSYVQLHEFGASVCLTQNKVSKPKASIKWMLMYRTEWNSLGINLRKMWKGEQRAELERKRLTEECVIAQDLMESPFMEGSFPTLTILWFYVPLVTWLHSKFSTLFNSKQ